MILFPLYMYVRYLYVPVYRSSGGAVVIRTWLLENDVVHHVQGSIPSLAASIPGIGYLLLPSRDMAEISLNRHKSSK